MNTALGRPAYRDEVPGFGSVWRWTGHGTRFVFLRLTGTGRIVMMEALRIEPRWIGVDATMAWGSRDEHGELTVASGWHCVMEGPS